MKAKGGGRVAEAGRLRRGIGRGRLSPVGKAGMPARSIQLLVLLLSKIHQFMDE